MAWYCTHQYSDEPESGVAYYTCSECGKIDPDRVPGGHVHDYTWAYDAEGHWHQCTFPCGECDAPTLDEKVAHTFNATYPDICDECGYVVAHAHDYDTEGICKHCGYENPCQHTFNEINDVCDKCEHGFLFYEGTALVQPSSLSILSNSFNDGKGIIETSGPIVGIPDKEFISSTDLTGITIGNSVETIGSKAFDACRNLTKIFFSQSIKSAGRNAFNACQPNKIEAMWHNPLPFSDLGFSSLNYRSIELTVPSTAENNYRSADTWKEFNITTKAHTHTYGDNPANATAYCTCKTCGYQEHRHTYSTEWSTDATHHWHECTMNFGTCNARQKDKTAHSYDDNAERGTTAYYTCVCGHIDPVRQHVHNYEWVVIDEHQHKQVCTSEVGNCTAREINQAEHIYQESSLDATEYYTCSVCEYVDNERKTAYDSRDYMGMTAVGGEVTIGAFPYHNPTYVLQYSADRTYWTDYAVKDEGAIVTIPKGQTYYFRTASPTVQKSVMDVSSGHPTVGEEYWNFTMSGTGTIKAGGNIMSLLDQTCQSLTVGDFCFIGLFVDCTLLTDAPKLPATTLGESCYDGMFAGCTILQKAPHLPATALPLDCYANMFEGCESLNYVEADFTETVPTNRYSYTPQATRFEENTKNWLKGTAAEGNLVLKREMIEKNFIDTDHIDMPTGWRKALKIWANEDPDNKGKFYTTYYDNKNIYITDDFKAYTGSIESSEGGYELRLDAISSGFIPSNTGVLIYSNKPDVVLPIYGYSVPSIEGNVLTGTNTDASAPANCYILSYGQDRLGFYRYAQGKALSAHKAYLIYQHPAGAQARALRMVFDDDEVNGIENINDNPSTDSGQAQTIYNLSGVRLNKLQKGINIVNGKKIVVK